MFQAYYTNELLVKDFSPRPTLGAVTVGPPVGGSDHVVASRLQMVYGARSMRVLFLDFDGVLHPFGGHPLFRHMPHLYTLLEKHPEVRLVVHSSWREIRDDSELRTFLFAQRRPDLANRFLGATPREVMSRWESIEAWVAAHPEVEGPFCVLDDEPRLFPSHIAQGRDPKFHFIGCDSKRGLSESGPELAGLSAWLDSAARAA